MQRNYLLMKILKSTYFLLFVIVLIAAFLRFYNLGTNPAGIHADEADTGYTAYSLIHTSKDPYGYKWPLQFKGQANNYRGPLYTYSVIPSVLIFGLSPFSERLPSAVFGTLTTIVIFFLAKNLFKTRETGLTAAFLMAINPWSIQISRTGLEVGLSLFLVLLGTTLFLYHNNKKNSSLLLFSAIAFGLSFFSYHSAKIFVPLVIPILFFYKWQDIRNNIKIYTIFLGVVLFFYSVMLYLAFFNFGATEFNNVSIFNSQEAGKFVNSQRHLTLAPLQLSSIFRNKPEYYYQNFVTGLLNPFSVNYLFLNGDSSLDKALGNYGEYHIFELPFFLIGSYFIIRRKKKEATLLLLLTLASVVPGAITKNGYYTYRDINLLPIPILVSAFGLKNLIPLILKNRKLIPYSMVFIIICTVFFTRFFYILFFEYPVYSYSWWGGTQKNVVRYLNENKISKSVFIHGGFDWPIIYAFYNKIDPVIFQNSYLNQKDGRFKIYNITFGNIFNENSSLIPEKELQNKSLYIFPSNYFKDSPSVAEFKSPDGVNVETRIYETK